MTLFLPVNVNMKWGVMAPLGIGNIAHVQCSNKLNQKISHTLDNLGIGNIAWEYSMGASRTKDKKSHLDLFQKYVPSITSAYSSIW